MPVLKNVPVSWASVLTPNTQFEPAWEIQVELTKEQADQLRDEAKALHKKGIKIKEENGRFFFRFRRKVMRADGTSENQPPVVVGPDGKAFTKLIGNGSICNVQYGLSVWENKFGTGVTNDLKGVRVINHVAYGEQDGEGLMDDDDDVPNYSKPKKEKPRYDDNEYDDDDDL